MNLALLGKTSLALVVVLVCVLGCGWLARRVGSRPLSPGKLLRVVSSTGVGQREKVVIVEVRGQWLVLGVTPQQVTALAQMDAPEAEPVPITSALDGSFAERLTHALKHNLTRKGRSS
ncbi:flagellar biosynthetic protein FliO [Pseudomonas poae]|uniref:Flagellar protein n=2 Tax=Pseudomonas poae TaxID=200451 RepID=A0A2S9EL09_9PSED|nr:flagellar biosynthetic protein FliO [Pseudomonas poae]PRC16037.1 flagellar biosynthetic protein FliO [Pseudomonas poae]